MAIEFTIGQMAKLFATTVKTLRYYDARGLLKPARVDANSGYRYYTVAQFERLNTIQYLQKLGLSLADIQTHLSALNKTRFIAQLQQVRDQVATQIAELQAMDQRLAARIDALSTPIQYNQPRLIQKAARPCWRMDTAIKTTAELELSVRKIGQQAQAATIFSGGIGLIRSQSDLKRGDFSAFSALYIEAVDGPDTLLGGQFAQILVNASHDHIKPGYDQLLAFMQANHLHIAGDALECTLVDQDVSADFSEYCTEILIPVLTLP